MDEEQLESNEKVQGFLRHYSAQLKISEESLLGEPIKLAQVSFKDDASLRAFWSAIESSEFSRTYNDQITLGFGEKPSILLQFKEYENSSASILSLAETGLDATTQELFNHNLLEVRFSDAIATLTPDPYKKPVPANIQMDVLAALTRKREENLEEHFTAVMQILLKNERKYPDTKMMDVIAAAARYRGDLSK